MRVDIETITILIVLLMSLVPSGAVIKTRKACVTPRPWMETSGRLTVYICRAVSTIYAFTGYYHWY